MWCIYHGSGRNNQRTKQKTKRKREQLIMTIKNTFAKVSMKLAKHSPAIFTGVGIVGLGATAYLAYKSRDKVEAVVDEIEKNNELETPVSKVFIARGIAEAVYQPVVVGAASITCILLAHRIQNKRILTLAGALAVEQTRNIYFEKKYRKQHGDEAYSKFVVPTDEEQLVEVDKNGKEKVTITDVKKDIDDSIGQWYSTSSEYALDDHAYNVAVIDQVNDRMQTILFQRGALTLNEVREALGFERTRNGALLGWTTEDFFEIEKHVSSIGNVEKGESVEQIWVTWSRARYVFGDIEFNGRYAI